MIIDHQSISDNMVSVLATVGQTRAMINISTDRVSIILHQGAGHRAQAFVYRGQKAMQRARLKHTEPEIAQIIAVADEINR